MPDHNVPTTGLRHGVPGPVSRIQLETLDDNCAEYGITELKELGVKLAYSDLADRLKACEQDLQI